MLQQKLPAIKPEENRDHAGASAGASAGVSAGASAGATAATAAKGFIDQYFGE